jgi:hypothetical protein
MMPPLKTVEQCNAYLDRLRAMSKDEREAHKLEVGIRDYFGCDAVNEMINIVTAERDWMLIPQADKDFVNSYDYASASEGDRKRFLAIMIAAGRNW